MKAPWKEGRKESFYPYDRPALQHFDQRELCMANAWQSVAQSVSTPFGNDPSTQVDLVDVLCGVDSTDMTLRIFAQLLLAMDRPRSHDSTSMVRTEIRILLEHLSPLGCMAGTTGLEPVTSAPQTSALAIAFVCALVQRDTGGLDLYPNQAQAGWHSPMSSPESPP